MYKEVINFTKRTNLSLACGLCFLYLLYKLLIKCGLLNSFINYLFVFKVEEGLKGEINNIATISNLVLNWVLIREFFYLKAHRYIAIYLIICAVIITINIANST